MGTARLCYSLFLHTRRSDGLVPLLHREYLRGKLEMCNSECFFSKHVLIFDINLVYLSPIDSLTCDTACRVSPTSVRVDKIYGFHEKKSSAYSFWIPEQHIFVAFPAKSYYCRTPNYEFDWLLKSAEIGCRPGQKLISFLLVVPKFLVQ